MEGEYYGICSSQESTSSKKKKKIYNGSGKLSQTTSDRISDLPDQLLIKILSSLLTKDAVKTSILSKRWENICTHVEKLHFVDILEELSPEHQRRFISFVDHALQRSPPDLKSFMVISGCKCFSNGSNFVQDAIHRWLQCIFKKNVERLHMQMGSVAYCAPEWFYNNTSFINLRISNWEVKILGSAVNWPSLKELHLSFVKIDDEQIEKILFGCPVLETLAFWFVTNITHLNIMSRSVKKLEIYQGSEVADILDLNAPWIRELEIYGSFTFLIPQMINVSSLITATFMLNQFTQNSDEDEYFLIDMAHELLESMNHVKELILWDFFIQALSIRKHLGRPSPRFMCKHLTVHISLVVYDLFGMACLLENSPHLENLVVVIKSLSEEFHFPKIFDKLIETETILIPPRENFLHLKNVEISYFKSDLCFVQLLQKYEQRKTATFPEIMISHYLSKNAPCVRKLVISTRLGNCKKCKTNCTSHYLSILSSKFFCFLAEMKDNSEWQVRKKCSTLEISRM